MRNVTLPFAPSVDDLFLLPQRVSQRAKAFAFHYGLDDLFGRIRGPGSMIAEPTLTGALNSSTLNSTGTFVQAVPPTPAPTAASASVSKAAGLFSWQNWKTAGGIFQYISSRWAIVTLLMVYFLTVLVGSCSHRFARHSSTIEPSSTLHREFRSIQNGLSDLASTSFQSSRYSIKYNGCCKAFAANPLRIGRSCTMAIPRSYLPLTMLVKVDLHIR